ncbi:MAG TPA: T9SS type A sorting domain-containing protein, partial [Lentimicrobium sp.]|nr:T9SS type A sorting domain-containing protein [Lentimicrobium sp.]
GTYYFRVQAIDQAYAGSAFSDEGSFEVLSTPAAHQPLQVPELMLQHGIIMVNFLPVSGGEAYLVGSEGRIHEARHFSGNNLEFSVRNLTSGLYVIRVLAEGKQWTWKFVK